MLQIASQCKSGVNPDFFTVHGRFRDLKFEGMPVLGRVSGATLGPLLGPGEAPGIPWIWEIL